MKVRSLTMKSFKRFINTPLSFADKETGLSKDLIVLVGQNGTGKSTVLQAIAATLGTAVRRLDKPSELKWPGFDLALASSSTVFPPEVELEVEFPQEEIDATTEYFKMISPRFLSDASPPSENAVVKLTLCGDEVRAPSKTEYFQFRGRTYAKQIVKIAEQGYDVFKRVGTVFWYTEHRTATTFTSERDDTKGIEYNEDLLRRTLINLMQFHERVELGRYDLRPGQRDIFALLEKAYKSVFTGRSFRGYVPRGEIDDVLKEPWFYLYDGTHEYEIAEMSGGERAVFPMFFDFANWNIHNSVILIDEIELHLHPPMQQALMRSLQDLGENNQFIVTTHSDWVVDAVPPETIVRLEA